MIRTLHPPETQSMDDTRGQSRAWTDPGLPQRSLTWAAARTARLELTTREGAPWPCHRPHSQSWLCLHSLSLDLTTPSRASYPPRPVRCLLVPTCPVRPASETLWSHPPRHVSPLFRPSGLIPGRSSLSPSGPFRDRRVPLWSHPPSQSDPSSGPIPRLLHPSDTSRSLPKPVRPPSATL